MLCLESESPDPVPDQAFPFCYPSDGGSANFRSTDLSLPPLPQYRYTSSNRRNPCHCTFLAALVTGSTYTL